MVRSFGELEGLVRQGARKRLVPAMAEEEGGLKGGGLLSHLALIQSPAYPKLLFMSDPGLNMAPDLSAKAAILENAVRSARKLELRAALENANPGSTPATLDAAPLAMG